MSAPAPAPEGDAPPPKKSKKKLFLLVGLVLVLLAGGGAGALVFLNKKKHADSEEVEVKVVMPKNPPVYLPMDPLVVNLADPGGDRMVQLGISIQLADQKTADQVKVFMPAIRGKVLMLVSQRTANELLQRDGKEQLADAILREVGLPLGIVSDEPESEPKQKDKDKEKGEGDEAEPSKPSKKRAKAIPNSPVQAVLFTSFIIQ